MEILLRKDGTYLDWPDLAAGRGGEVLLACSCHHGSGSSVATWRVDCGGAVPVWQSGPVEDLFLARVVSGGGEPGSVVAAWTESLAGPGVTLLFPGSSRRARIEGLAEPCLVASGRGPVFLAGRSRESIVAMILGTDGPTSMVEVSRPGGRVFSPAAAPDGEGGILVVWEQERTPGCAILACRLSHDARPGRVMEIDPDGPTGHAPHAALLPDGRIAVAWHAPAAWQPPQHLVKDVRLALVSGDEVLCPEAGMAPDPGDEPRGEDQGFELPHIVAAGSGAVLVLGSSSQGFKRRLLDASGWRDPVGIDASGWGCRGASVRGARSAAGVVWTATREREGIVVRSLDVESGACAGPPPAARRTVRCSGRDAALAPLRGDPRRDRDGRATWFGDVHQHSAFSDGTGLPHEAYVRCRDFYGDDVTALTDHESFLGKRTTNAEWVYLQDLARRFCEPGRLATLPAYEWTGKAIPGPGHKVVIFASPGAALASREDPTTSSGTGLLAAIAGSGGMAIPHHVGWTGADEPSHREDVQPCMEVVSCHGAYERRADHLMGRRDPVNGPFLRELLERGLRFGFMGGSDGHGLLWHHGVSRRRDSHRTGLTGFVARDLTPACIADAILCRRTFATSGPPMWIRLWVEGSPMGSVARPADPSRVSVEIEVDAGAPVSRALLVLNGSEILVPSQGSTLRHSCTIDVGPGPARFVYLRLERQDGECGWASPVFLD